MASKVTFVVDAEAILEVIESDTENLTEAQKRRAVRDILSAAQDLCLFSLASFVVEASDIDLADYEDEDDDDEDDE